jgi:hypothetical protein
MRFELRRLRAGELDHELIWLCVTVGAAAVMIGWMWLQLAWPTCSFRTITGLPCLTCGATRAAVSLLRGDWLAAWRFNPLATAAMSALAAYNIYAALVLLMRAPRVRIVTGSPRVRPVVLSIAAVVALLNWTYLLLHMH